MCHVQCGSEKSVARESNRSTKEDRVQFEGGAVRRMGFRSDRYVFLRPNVTVVAILTLGIIGCSGSSAINGHPATTLSGPGAGSTGIGPNHSQSSNTEGKKRPPRPGSVSSIFSSMPAILPCPDGSTLWIAAGTNTAKFTVAELDVQFVCFSGIDASSSPTLFVTTPSGVRRTVDIQPSGNDWEWILYPGPGQGLVDTVGHYSFELVTSTPAGGGSTAPNPSASASPPPTTGSSSAGSPLAATNDTLLTAAASSSPARQRVTLWQSSLVSSGRFTVAQPTEPRAKTIVRRPTTGQQLLVSLAGFPPHSSVFVTLYGPGSRSATTFPLFLDLPSLITNANGEGLLQWLVPTGTTAGYYGVLISPPPPPCSATAACFPFSIDS
jgi:hypothetical protein